MKHIIQQIKYARELIGRNDYITALLMMVLCIEWIGAVLDKQKPLKAIKQSQRRFQKALEFIGSAYAYFNREGFLYHALRNHLIHTGILSKRIELVIDASMHLKYNEKKQLVIDLKVLLNDIENAVNKLNLN